MASVVQSFTLSGIEGHIVKVETDVLTGPPSVSIVGLGDKAIKEAKTDWKPQSSTQNLFFLFKKSFLI